MIMASPRMLTTTQTWTLVRQTATKVPSTAVDKLVQIITATVGEVKVLLFLRAGIWRRTSRMIPNSL